MQSGRQKILVGALPFLVFILSIIIIAVLFPKSPTGLDSQWPTRLFVLGLVIFSGLMLIPNFLQLQLIWKGKWPRLRIKLTHHPPSSRQDHEMFIRGTFVCIGCFGNLLGLLGAEIIFLVYVLEISLITSLGYLPFIYLGIFLLLFSYSRYLLFLDGYIRLIQHSALFIGLSFLVVGSDLFLTSALALVLLLPSWISFLVARILLSRIEHEGTAVNIV